LIVLLELLKIYMNRKYDGNLQNLL